VHDILLKFVTQESECSRTVRYEVLVIDLEFIMACLTIHLLYLNFMQTYGDETIRDDTRRDMLLLLLLLLPTIQGIL